MKTQIGNSGHKCALLVLPQYKVWIALDTEDTLAAPDRKSKFTLKLNIFVSYVLVEIVRFSGRYIA